MASIKKKINTFTVISLFTLSSVADAQFNNQGVEPTYNKKFVHVESSHVGKESLHIRHLGLLQYSFIDDPLVETRDGETTSVVDSSHTGAIGYKALHRRLSLSLDSTFAEVKLADKTGEFAFGDTKIAARIHKEILGLWWSGGVELTVPTGSKDLFLSGGTTGGSVVAGVEERISKFAIAGTFTYRKQPEARYKSLDYSTILRTSAGVNYQIWKELNAGLEWFGSFPSNNIEASTGETYVGFMWHPNREYTFHPGLSVANVSDSRNSTFRIIVGLKYEPTRKRGKRRKRGKKRKRKRKNSVKVVVSKKKCKKQAFSNTYFARALSNQELANFSELPYHVTGNSQNVNQPAGIGVLDIGQMSGKSLEGIPYVEDKHVIFGIEVFGLPDRKNVKDIKLVSLRMELTKLSSDRSADTEIICLIEQKACSGSVFKNPRWEKYINKEFFKKNPPASRTFDNILTRNQVGKVGSKKLYSVGVNFDLNNLGIKNMTDILYQTNNGSKKLFFVVADDVYVSSGASLVVSILTQTCQ